MAFQIKDDLFDYTDQKIGKPVGIDIREKKITLPMIYVLNSVKIREKKWLINSIKVHNKNKKRVKFIDKSVKHDELNTDYILDCSGKPDDDSSFSIISPEQSDGNYSLTITAADSSGNISEISDSLSLTIDTALPGIPRVTTTETATNDTTPTIEGVAEAGSTVTLFVDGTITEVTATADVTGAFTITLPEKVDGTYDLTFTARDGAGNTSSESSVFSSVSYTHLKLPTKA
mgnify:CR=1 FL=1